jgi:hypothetical protein
MLLLPGSSVAQLKERLQKTYRIFPQHKIAGIAKTQIARFPQPFANIPTLAQLSTSFVLLFLRCANFAKSQFNIRRELECWAME